MINIKEINPCDPVAWLEEFKANSFYQNIAKNFNHVIGTNREMTVLKAALHHTVYEKSRNFCNDYKILDSLPYYYIEYLRAIDPKDVIDIGCGLNIFKNVFPNIVGLDADVNSKCDVFDFFDQDFVNSHQKSYDALITINTIHFLPVTRITQQLQWLASMLKDQGRAYVSFSLETWLMHTDKHTCQLLFGNYPSFDSIVNYVNDQILATQLNFLVVDWPVLKIPNDGTIRDDYNGNIRLVFSK